MKGRTSKTRILLTALLALMAGGCAEPEYSNYPCHLVYNGIIVGFSNLDGKFYAYDNQCRNCYESTSLPRYQLTLGVDGLATCKSCHRVYDMNSHGILVKGDKGKGMIRYKGNTTGAYGVLTVN